METKTTVTPEQFTAKHPKYVYYSGKGVASVQWRQAALELYEENVKLRSLLESTISMYASGPQMAVVAKAALAKSA